VNTIDLKQALKGTTRSGRRCSLALAGEDKRPAFGIHMMIRTSSEEELLQEKVSLLQVKITCLQQLIAELLLKNQRLRDASGDRAEYKLRGGAASLE
jgi:hypothetical protein